MLEGDRRETGTRQQFVGGSGYSEKAKAKSKSKKQKAKKQIAKSKRQKGIGSFAVIPKSGGSRRRKQRYIYENEHSGRRTWGK